jgi:hypothetical protein
MALAERIQECETGLKAMDTRLAGIDSRISGMDSNAHVRELKEAIKGIEVKLTESENRTIKG